MALVVGLGRAMELIITGRAVGAADALRIGLANEVVPREQVLPRALELARDIRAAATGSYSHG